MTARRRVAIGKMCDGHSDERVLGAWSDAAARLGGEAWLGSAVSRPMELHSVTRMAHGR